MIEPENWTNFGESLALPNPLGWEERKTMKASKFSDA
jgi:hypothetical protein